MNYSLHQLKIFLTVIETESITKAAEVLHLTQPAISIQLKNLQNQFNIPLTEIIGRKLYITDFGREIAVHAKEIIDQMDTIKYKTLSYQGRLAGKLKLAVVSTGKYIIPYFLSEFLSQNSSIELEIDVTNKSKVIEKLENNVIDLKNKLYLVGKAESTFSKKIIDTQFLQTIPLIYREQGSSTRYLMEQFLELNGVKNQNTLELTSNEAVKQAVLAGLGFSIMPLIGLRNEISSGELKIIPINRLPIVTEWHLIWLSDKKHSFVSQAFIEHVKENKNSIIDTYFSWYDNY
jgi:DNA-binding transcriptional LysR family regulator